MIFLWIVKKTTGVSKLYLRLQLFMWSVSWDCFPALLNRQINPEFSSLISIFVVMILPESVIKNNTELVSFALFMILVSSSAGKQRWDSCSCCSALFIIYLIWITASKTTAQLSSCNAAQLQIIHDIWKKKQHKWE